MMDDYAKTSYWTAMADYDLETAKVMHKGKRYLYVGFMCHQTIEKILKAKFVEMHPPEQLPYIHKLVELATKAKVFDKMDEAQQAFLREVTPLNIEARYPRTKDKIFELLTEEYTKSILERTEEMLKWLKEN